MSPLVHLGFLFLFATNSHAQKNFRHDCKEGEIASMQNNRGENCTCINGRWACTAKDCDDQTTPTPTTSVPVTNCVPDENIDYTDFCGCFCLDGWWACATCTPSTTESSTPGSGICQDGQTTLVDNGCNTCYCMGGAWACTDKFCATTSATPTTTKICEDGDETSFDGCNKCRCMNGVWGCTKMFCQTTTVEPQCQQTQTTFDGCNTCFCNNGIWACTLKLCAETTPTTQQVCKEGETTAFDSCNSCSCTNGVWLCTKMACSSNTDNTVSQSTTELSSTTISTECRPGSRKIEDCNRCYCNETGNWICFKMASCNNNKKRLYIWDIRK